MPTKYKDYPIYSYNEPATYNDFTGGINTDPSNEHLLDNEMRDCVNMTYLSGALVKRKGAKEICKITCNEDLTNIQGVFLFTYRITYIIVAANGKLYSGVFNENTTIKLEQLFIYKNISTIHPFYDETNTLEGLTTFQKSDIVPDKHEGFLVDYIKDTEKDTAIQLNKRTNWNNISSGMIEYGDYFEQTEGYYTSKYVCINPFEKTVILPSNVEYWEPLDPLDENFESLTQTAMQWSINNYNKWYKNRTILYENTYYKCLKDHYNRYASLEDTTLFTKSNALNTKYTYYSLLVFQNYRPIEAATFDNKLYVMTGTRIITVYVQNNTLVAEPLIPHVCNNSEVINIGYNYVSPYPELAVATQEETVTTSLRQLIVRKTLYGKYILDPVFNVQIGDDLNNYWFRWEKFIDGSWYTIVPFKIQDVRYQNALGLYSDKSYASIEVDDADKYLYRVTFAKSFETPDILVNDWKYDDTLTFEKGLLLKANGIIYKCLETHPCNNQYYPENIFTPVTVINNETKYLWEIYMNFEVVNFYSVENNVITKTTIEDYKIDKVDGEYFGQATSVLWKELDINDKFTLIHSCTKILVDGNKLLYYGDNYNSGQWFKTIINNPGYVTDRGCLSFKTTKNEALIKVVAFQGNIICFANAENVGGSIHIVTGNGDDYDDSSGYYSPYQRRTINSTVSSDNPNTVQVCDNILIFKYFKKLYYINASDLSNDVIKVTQCNQRVLSSSRDVEIPWDDNSCISEVTNDYYALLWKEKYSIDNANKLVQERPAIRLKMYFNMSNTLEDKTTVMPWLRDESKYFNTSNIIYYKGRSLILYNNILVSYNENTYEDLNEIVPCTIKLKGEELNYAKIFKLISSILIYYHREQHSKVDFNLITRNEAGHILYNSKDKLFSINDLRVFKEGDPLSAERIRLDSTIQDTKLFTVVNKFPCLLAESTITSENKGTFSLSSITYYYDTIDAPDSNPYDMYTNIIRPEEVY